MKPVNLQGLLDAYLPGIANAFATRLLGNRKTTQLLHVLHVQEGWLHASRLTRQLP
jgi:hypothetical protein